MDRIRINNYIDENPKVKENMRIASISDIHSEVELLDKLFEILKRIRVDMICMPGDIIDRVNDSRNKDLFEILRKISCVAKTYISMGNHDIYERGRVIKYDSEYNYDFFNELERKSDCTVLTKPFETIRHDDNVTVNAFNFPLNYYLQKEDERISDGIITSFKGTLDSESFNILLSHSPNRLIHNDKLLTMKAILNEMNLILSGHNHGCLTPMFIQDRSKKHVGLVGPYRQKFLKNGFGAYSDEKASLVINNGVIKIAKSSGLGFSGKVANKILIPDVDVITVKKGKENTLTLKNRRIVKM